MDSFKVILEGPAPWGFRLQGGKDFNVPLSISRLTPGGKAAQAGVAVGDWVLNIDGENAGGLTHIEAQNKIRACGERLSLGLSRAQPSQSKQQKVDDGWVWDIWAAGGIGVDVGSLSAASVPPSLARNRGWKPKLGRVGESGVRPGAAARSGHLACLSLSARCPPLARAVSCTPLLSTVGV